jgi:hypothetical protein
MRWSLTVATILALVIPPAVATGQGQMETAGPDTSSQVTALDGAPGQETVTVTGTASFGGQRPVEVADDPANDANLTPRIGDLEGTEPGVDLLTASLSVPDPGVPELLMRWQVADLPTERMIPEAVRYTFPFKVGNVAYRVQAKFSNVADPESPLDSQILGAFFELRGNCTASFMGTGIARCEHLAWLSGSVDPVSSTVSIRVPLGSAAASQIVLGAEIRRNDSLNPDLNDLLAGYELGGVTPSTPVDDRATLAPSFTIPAPDVALGLAPPGTDARNVTYDTPATLSADGSFSGTVSTIGMQSGTFDVFARACFANNCGYRSLGGQSLAIGDLAAALSIPKPGEPDRSFAFWDGANAGDRLFYATPSAGLSTCANAPCYTYKLRVDTPGAARLRIALDVSQRRDGYFLQVVPPAGNSQSRTNSNQFNSELFFDAPPTGIYTITVRPASTQNSAFAMRAKLEQQIPARQSTEDGLIPPNLRPTAPYELGFAAPVLAAANGPFIAPDDANPPLGAAGHGAASCTPDETLDDQAIRCLRFSFGLSNIGPGPFTIRGPGNAATPQPLYQCVQRADGTVFSRPAGMQQFHQEHLHNHYLDLIQVELHRVTDPEAGTMVPAGDGRKLGYSPADQSIADWDAFNQEPGTGSSLDCDGGGLRFALSIGWGDVYRYQRLGNFVNFGLNPDGLYVVRLKIDPLNTVLEANENDNTSYTYVRVTLDQIDILEYGRGQSPFDPNKQVLQLRRKAGVPW